MDDSLFKELEVTDPLTGKKRVLTPEEIEDLLEKGVFLGSVQNKDKKAS